MIGTLGKQALVGFAFEPSRKFGGTLGSRFQRISLAA
jgi:hypothetical protein